MKSLIEYVAEYLASKLHKVLAGNLFITTMPKEPVDCISIYEEEATTYVPAQVDAEVHFFRIRVRAKSILSALHTAQQIVGHLQTDSPDYPDKRLSEIDTTGILHLADDLDVYVELLQQPVAIQDASVQSSERIVDLVCKMISKKLC